MLPPLNMAEVQLQVTYLLASYVDTKLGDYSGAGFNDKRISSLLHKFQDTLQENGQAIKKRNKEAVENGHDPYNYLVPDKVPRSVNI